MFCLARQSPVVFLSAQAANAECGARPAGCLDAYQRTAGLSASWPGSGRSSHACSLPKPGLCVSLTNDDAPVPMILETARDRASLFFDLCRFARQANQCRNASRIEASVSLRADAVAFTPRKKRKWTGPEKAMFQSQIEAETGLGFPPKLREALGMTTGDYRIIFSEKEEAPAQRRPGRCCHVSLHAWVRCGRGPRRLAL